jgi:hypothetical protein
MRAATNRWNPAARLVCMLPRVDQAPCPATVGAYDAKTHLAALLGPVERGAQQVPGLDRHVRVVAWPTTLTRAGRLPRRERPGRDPDRQAAALLQRLVVFPPVLYPVARPRDFVTACFIEPMGHWASRERGRSGPIPPNVALPKPATS